MGRSRIHNVHLPERVYLSRGRYYIAVRGRWFPLGADEQRAIAKAASFVTPKEMTTEEIESHLLSMLPRIKQQAKGRKLSFALLGEQIIKIVRDAKHRCAVTGLRFSADQIGKGNRRPYVPSIDRIDSVLGYEPDNCRVVCAAANMAMNCWGEAVLHRMLEGRRSGRLLGKF